MVMTFCTTRWRTDFRQSSKCSANPIPEKLVALSYVKKCWEIHHINLITRKKVLVLYIPIWFGESYLIKLLNGFSNPCHWPTWMDWSIHATGKIWLNFGFLKVFINLLFDRKIIIVEFQNSDSQFQLY